MKINYINKLSYVQRHDDSFDDLQKTSGSEMCLIHGMKSCDSLIELMIV